MDTTKFRYSPEQIIEYTDKMFEWPDYEEEVLSRVGAWWSYATGQNDFSKYSDTVAREEMQEIFVFLNIPYSDSLQQWDNYWKNIDTREKALHILAHSSTHHISSPVYQFLNREEFLIASMMVIEVEKKNLPEYIQGLWEKSLIKKYSEYDEYISYIHCEQRETSISMSDGFVKAVNYFQVKLEGLQNGRCNA